MKAVVIENNQVDFKDTDDPINKENQMLVSVISAGLNGADILQKKGGYPAMPPWPQHIPGLEVAGTVVAMGSAVENFAVGDLVMSLVGGGAQAELAVVEPEYALKIPKELDPTKAGGFCETFFTAYDALINRADLKMGDEILIVGAQGGVGTAAIQIANIYNCNITAMVRNLKFETELINLHADKVVTGLKEEKFDVILDLVSGPDLSSRISNLKTEGRYVVIGVGAGFKMDINVLKIMEKRARLTGATLRSRSKFEKQLLAIQIQTRLLKFVKNGRIDVPIHKIYGFNQVQQAYADFENGGKLGKIILAN